MVGSIPLPGTGSFFLPFFSSTSFLAFLTLTALRFYPGVCVSVGRVLSVYLAGLLTIDFDYTWLMVVQLTFNFEVQLLRSIYQKNAEAMAIVLVQEF